MAQQGTLTSPTWQLYIRPFSVASFDRSRTFLAQAPSVVRWINVVLLRPHTRTTWTILQAPGGLLAVSRSGAGGSNAQDPASSPAGSKMKLIRGAADTEGGSRGGGKGGQASAVGSGGSGSSPQRKGVARPEEGARGRRGTRGSRTSIEVRQRQRFSRRRERT